VTVQGDTRMKKRKMEIMSESMYPSPVFNIIDARTFANSMAEENLRRGERSRENENPSNYINGEQ